MLDQVPVFRVSYLSISLVSLLSTSPILRAVDHYFDGTGSGWEVPSTWSLAPGASSPDPLTAPGALDQVAFNIASLTSPQTVNLNGNQSTLGLTVNSPGAVSILGGTQNSVLAIGSAGIALAPNAGTLIIGSAAAGSQVGVSLQASQNWINNSGPTSSSAISILNGFSAGVGANVNLALFANTPATINNTINGVISDGGGNLALTVNASDTGRWFLNGANTYTGETIINSGALAIKGSTALGSTTGGTRVSAGGALLLDTVGALANETIYLSGNGPASAPFGALQSIAGFSTLSTSIFVDTGTTSSGIGTVNGASFTINAPITASGTGQLLFQLDRTSATNGQININANVSHPGQTITIRSNGPFGGFIRLGRQNNYGDTIIESGTLQIGQDDGRGNLGTGSITIGATGTLSIAESGNLILGNSISGDGSITHSGRGNITLTAPNNLAGRTSITRGGTLTLDFRNLATPTNQTGTAGLTLTGGKLNIVGKNSGITSQLFGDTDLRSGVSYLAINSNGGTATNVGLGTLTRSFPGSALAITPPESGAITTSSANINGILGGYAIVSTSDWAANDGSGKIVPFSGYESNLSGVGNLDVPAGGGTLTGAPNTIRFNEQSASQLFIGTDTTITSGGILVTPNVGAHVSQISGSLPVKTVAGQDLIIFQNNREAALAVNAPIGSDLTKVGDGLLFLNAASTTAFTTRISQGMVSVSSPDQLGTSAAGITFQTGGSGVLQLAGNNTFNSAKVISLSGDAVIDVPVMATLTMPFGVSSTSANFTKTGNGTLVLSVSGGLSLYQGATILKGGILQIRSIFRSLGSSGDSADKLILDGGTLKLANALTLEGETTRLFSLGAGGGALDSSGGDYLRFTNPGAIAFTDPNTSLTLTLTGSYNAPNLLNPSLGDNGTGETSLLKAGTGYWELGGANSYSGGTTVAGGTLNVLATSSLGLGDVTVLSTASRLLITSSNAFAATATLSLAGDGILNGEANSGYLSLPSTVNATVSGLILGGVVQTELATYGATGSGATRVFNDYFRGTGTVTLIPEPGASVAIFSGLGVLIGSQRFRRR